MFPEHRPRMDHVLELLACVILKLPLFLLGLALGPRNQIRAANAIERPPDPRGGVTDAGI